MDREKFIETISIDEKGHYPFSLYVENENDEATLCALALNDVHSVYQEVVKFLMESPAKIYFTLDFPAGIDITTDFVAAYFKNGEFEDWESVIIPYDEQGNRLDLITCGEMFDRLLNQCKMNCRAMFKVRIVEKGN